MPLWGKDIIRRQKRIARRQIRQRAGEFSPVPDEVAYLDGGSYFTCYFVALSPLPAVKIRAKLVIELPEDFAGPPWITAQRRAIYSSSGPIFVISPKNGRPREL